MKVPLFPHWLRKWNPILSSFISWHYKATWNVDDIKNMKIKYAFITWTVTFWLSIVTYKLTLQYGSSISSSERVSGPLRQHILHPIGLDSQSIVTEGIQVWLSYTRLLNTCGTTHFSSSKQNPVTIRFQSEWLIFTAAQTELVKTC